MDHDRLTGDVLRNPALRGSSPVRITDVTADVRTLIGQQALDVVAALMRSVSASGCVSRIKPLMSLTEAKPRALNHVSRPETSDRRCFGPCRSKAEAVITASAPASRYLITSLEVSTPCPRRAKRGQTACKQRQPEETESDFAGLLSETSFAPT